MIGRVLFCVGLLITTAEGAHRNLQSSTRTCASMMMETQKIITACCGTNFRYCHSGAVPSKCTSKCVPIFESFYTRCANQMKSSPNRKDYTKFQGLCHPASKDTSAVLFQDNFEHGLSKWKGKNTAAKPHTARIGKDPSNRRNNVLRLHGCTSSGDAFSSATVACSHEQPCLVSYRIRGRAWQGFSSTFPGNHIWTATPNDYEGQHVQTDHDIHHWHKVEYVFPVTHANFVHGDYTTKITKVIHHYHIYMLCRDNYHSQSPWIYV